MGKELIGNDARFTEIAKRGGNAFGPFATISEHQMGITTTEAKDIMADLRLCRRWRLLARGGQRFQITFHLYF